MSDDKAVMELELQGSESNLLLDLLHDWITYNNTGDIETGEKRTAYMRIYYRLGGTKKFATFIPRGVVA